MADHVAQPPVTTLFGDAATMVQPEFTRTLVAAILDRAARGELQVVIDRAFPLADAADAHRYIERRQGFGRVLLLP